MGDDDAQDGSILLNQVALALLLFSYTDFGLGSEIECGMLFSITCCLQRVFLLLLSMASKRHDETGCRKCRAYMSFSGAGH